MTFLTGLGVLFGVMFLICAGISFFAAILKRNVTEAMGWGCAMLWCINATWFK